MNTFAHVDVSIDPDVCRRVVLIGFMGTGKTTLARRWARSGGPLLWFDSDEAVLARLGATSVTAAFAQHGEQTFREVEREVILHRRREVVRGMDVWSLGGGAVMQPDVQQAIADACVVWLDADVDELWARVAGSDRPLARDHAAFSALHDERRATYERLATVRIEAHADVEQLPIGRVLADHLPEGWFGNQLAIGDGLIDRIEDLAVLCTGPAAIVADQAVNHVADRIVARLRDVGRPPCSDLRLPMGEWHKQLATAEQLLRAWADAGIHRGGTIIAVGGGTLLDCAGFAASIYQRGIAWVSVPTTLTAQVDAGIGGKTAVNLGVAKNVIGSVHLPKTVLVDPTVTSTLPAAAIRDGFVESAKSGMLAGEWLLTRASAVANASTDAERATAWPELVHGCASFKSAVVDEDPFDSDGVRAQLNLGHTLAHAIESATGGAVSHGAAVAIGVHAALHLSALVLQAPSSLVDVWCELCTKMGVVTTSPLNFADLEPYLRLDKKRDDQGIAWVLLANVGEPVTEVRIPTEAVRRVWNDHVRVPAPLPAKGDRSAVTGNSRDLETKRILVLFGANLGQLGRRDASHYGTATLPALVRDIEAWSLASGMVAECRQTDSLERFLHAIHEADRRHDAVIVNPGAWTHHERSLHDALEMLDIPRVEVHLSDIMARESWRHASVISDVCDHSIHGSGADGYQQAISWLRERWRAGDEARDASV